MSGQEHDGADPHAAILEVLRQHLAAMARHPPDGVHLSEVRFREDLALDSLDRVEFIARVEQHFGLPLSDDDVDGLGSLGEVAALVSARMTSKK